MLRPMSFVRTVKSLGLLALLSGLAAGGCAYGELRQVLRTEVAAELDCPSITVEPRNSEALRGARDGDDQWKVRGCGIVRTYTCAAAGDDMVSYDGSGCSYVDGDVDAPKLATDDSPDLLEGEPTEGGETLSADDVYED